MSAKALYTDLAATRHLCVLVGGRLVWCRQSSELRAPSSRSSIILIEESGVVGMRAVRKYGSEHSTHLTRRHVDALGVTERRRKERRRWRFGVIVGRGVEGGDGLGSRDPGRDRAHNLRTSSSSDDTHAT